MVIADVSEWWDRYGDLVKKNKINEMIGQIKDVRYRNIVAIGTTEYLGTNTGGVKDTPMYTKSGMTTFGSYQTICRVSTSTFGFIILNSSESDSASWNTQSGTFCTTVIGYGIQQITIGASNHPWNAGVTTWRIIDSGGYYLLQASHTKYYGGSVNWAVRIQGIFEDI